MFALVDRNSFYCSCEAVFQPRLWGKPVVVLSNNDGCVIARSTEAKAVGIPMGAPEFLWREQFKKLGVEVFSSNYELYGDLSARVMQLLGQAAAAIEVYSIDEAFLRLDGMAEQLQPVGRDLRAQVKQWTGIPVGVGIGATKILAKLANRTPRRVAACTRWITRARKAGHSSALGPATNSGTWQVNWLHG